MKKGFFSLRHKFQLTCLPQWLGLYYLEKVHVWAPQPEVSRKSFGLCTYKSPIPCFVPCASFHSHTRGAELCLAAAPSLPPCGCCKPSVAHGPQHPGRYIWLPAAVPWAPQRTVKQIISLIIYQGLLSQSINLSCRRLLEAWLSSLLGSLPHASEACFIIHSNIYCKRPFFFCFYQQFYAFLLFCFLSFCCLLFLCLMFYEILFDI